MKKTKINNLLFMLIIFISIVFLIYSYKYYKVEENFISVPLNFTPEDSISTYDWNGILVKVHGGFVKGKIKNDNNQENLIIRSLSPTPTIIVTNNTQKTSKCFLQIENINPSCTNFEDIKDDKIKIINPHTISFALNLEENKQKVINIKPKDTKNYFEFVIFGDNRDGYKTFLNILDQVNNINPVFSIDDGDLVFGGEPHKYRLFYQSISKVKIPFYTALGNHDIRENGIITYTKLFGPPYYSFDYKNVHFVF